MNSFPLSYSGVSPTRLLDESMIPLVGTPHTMTYIPMEEVFAFVERRPNQELPAITEENEEQTLRRYRSHTASSVERRSRNGSTDLPQEPEEFAPGLEMESRMAPELDYPYIVGPVHRRAVSDNLGVHDGRKTELRRTQEMEEIDQVGMHEDVTMRSSRLVGRASSVVSNRCQSQVFLPEIGLSDTASSAPALDRNLSSSDPSINEEKPLKTHECPPPVLLTRKASSKQNDWKKLSSSSLAQPPSVQLRKEPVSRDSRPQSMTRGENDDVTTPSPSSSIASFSRGVNFMRRSWRRLAGDSRRDSVDAAVFRSLDDTVTACDSSQAMSSAECACMPSEAVPNKYVRRVATVPTRQRTTTHLKQRWVVRVCADGYALHNRY
ncbi:hypothetical protein ANCCAN_17132 [Ancylostoma caninum]|uniref:Uncharacterized protein n=1 Tax=Ancylostoma caninum TaxID=29170 RepID=A0A368FXR4_ANCCA|nr:hypothetical protein ANCCAN_17132 [Ancylostoma caninum]